MCLPPQKNFYKILPAFMTDNQHITIGCMGMTHLGLVHACAFAEKGFNLVCYDSNSALIESLQQSDFPIEEPDFKALCHRHFSQFHFSSQIQDLVACDVIFIAYDVPTDGQGNSDLTVIRDLIEAVQPVLSSKTTLVLLSQVPPGFTRQLPIKKDRLFYQVETLIFGCAMERARFPERYIVGMNDPTSILPSAYARLLESFHCPILKMRYESAELAKISINLFLVSSVSTTNMIAEVCESIGADWADIAPTLRLDKRIGPHAYLKPGLGIAGGNLERDLKTLTHLGSQYGIDTGIISAWQKKLAHRRDWVWRCLQQFVFNLKESPLICILGLAYKPDTHSIKNSASIALIQQLHRYSIHTHDPLVNVSFPNAQQYLSVEAAVSKADVVIIMTPWAEYKTLSIDQLLDVMQGSTIIDPYGVLDVETASEREDDLLYCTLGKKPRNYMPSMLGASVVGNLP